MKKIANLSGLILLAVSMLQLSNVSAASAANTLSAGQSLSKDQMITSADGRFAFVMQSDGNLVHYNAGNSLWDSDTRGDSTLAYDPYRQGYITVYAAKLTLIAGTLRITDMGVNANFWEANTRAWMDSYYTPPMIYPTGLVGDTLVAQDDGNVVLYDTIGNSGGSWLPVWATNTGGR